MSGAKKALKMNGSDAKKIYGVNVPPSVGAIAVIDDVLRCQAFISDALVSDVFNVYAGVLDFCVSRVLNDAAGARVQP